MLSGDCGWVAGRSHRAASRGAEPAVFPSDCVLFLSQGPAAEKGLAWDIALVVGYHRGVLVTAQYKPGPRGGAFDSRLASNLGEVYRAQIAKLDY